MQTYVVDLESETSDSFRCVKAANSLDIDVTKKSKHHFKINADVLSDFNIGLIVGASGSGKTTLAKQIYGEDCFKEYLDLSKPIIEQLPKEFSYDECAQILSGVGLTSVPCWIRPAYTLSNGQKARAEAALAMTIGENSIIDEWTSVVDRTVGKVMSHCISKHARKNKKQIILCACHYDIIDWLQPDWIIDCNKQTFEDRRSLWQIENREKLEFTIKEIDRKSWKYFSKYHYLSENLPGGTLYIYGLFHGENQIGFQCFANYVPSHQEIYHSNRTVIHPDYAGFGIGIKLINATSKIVKEKYSKRIMAKFSSIPIYKSLIKQTKLWKLVKIHRSLKKNKFSKNFARENKFRVKVKTYSFEYIG